MSNEFLCPLCEEGTLTEQRDKNKVEYKGERIFLDALFSECNCCGAEQANSQQMKYNKRQMVAFKKGVDHLLTGNEVRVIREHLGLKQSDAAKIFGGGPVAFSKYESNDVTQSEAMDKLIRLAHKVPQAFEHLAKYSDFDTSSQSKEKQSCWSAVSQSSTQQKPINNSKIVQKARLQQSEPWVEVKCG
jgi:HTH-type transcriptional regulator/antitoxin MqsA